MTRGKNLAVPANKFVKDITASVCESVTGKPYTKSACIFISHQKADSSYGRILANYIMDSGIDVYFDENDPSLKDPNIRTDPDKLTEAINSALNYSTDMLCIISEKTKLSWWVPYEIGFIWNKEGFSRKNIILFCIKDIKQYPEYLCLVQRIERIDEIDNFLASISGKEAWFNENYAKMAATPERHPLSSLLKW